MKIIDTENFEKLSGGVERVVAEQITDEAEAKVIVAALNETFSGPTADRYYVIVPDDYQLKQGYVC